MKNILEAELAIFFRWLPWRKHVEVVEWQLRWKLWRNQGFRSQFIPPGVFVLVNKEFFLK